MPRYAFRCPTCAGEFEVSRPMAAAGEEARCPLDGARAERVFSAPAVNVGVRAPSGRPPAPGGRGYSHFGHRHGPGTGTHSHGAPPTPPPSPPAAGPTGSA